MKLTHLSAAILLILASCNIGDLEFNDLQLQDLNPGIAVPLGSATYSIEELFQDIIEDTAIFNNDDSQLIVFTYYDTSVFEIGNDIVTIDDISSTGGLNPNLNVTAGVSTLTFPISKEFVFEYPASNEERLDSVFYSMGTLSYEVTSGFECDLDFTFVLENTINTVTNEPVSFDESFVYSGSSPITSTQTISLPEHKTVLTQQNGVNVFIANIEGTLTVNTGQGITLNDSLSFELTYSNQDFESIFGYFGQDTVSVASSTIPIDYLENATSAGIFFKAPEMNFTFNNSFGLPIGLQLEDVYAKNSSGDSIFLTGSGVDSPFIINYNENDITVPEQSEYTINIDNSNLQDLLEIGPNSFTFPITGFSNYQTPDGFNYVTDESSLETILEFNMPMEIRLEDFEQSISFDVEGSYNENEPDSVVLIINTINDLPIVGTMELQIVDADSMVSYTAASGIILEAPRYNVVGEIISPGETTANVILTNEGLEALKEASELRAVFTLNTPSSSVNDYFEVYADDQLTVNLSVAGTATIDL